MRTLNRTPVYSSMKKMQEETGLSWRIYSVLLNSRQGRLDAYLIDLMLMHP